MGKEVMVDNGYRRKYTRGRTLAGLFILVVGIGILGITFFYGNQLQESQEWPIVDGVVVNSFVEEYCDAEQSPSYYARVQYDYLVDGKLNRSQQVKFEIEKSHATHNRALKAIVEYPVGKSVIVHNDPQNPTTAVNDRSNSQITSFTWVGSGLSLLGGILLLGLLQEKRQE